MLRLLAEREPAGRWRRSAWSPAGARRRAEPSAPCSSPATSTTPCPTATCSGSSGGPELVEQAASTPASCCSSACTSRASTGATARSSNLLFRRDAGALMAYLVDAETAEHRPAAARGHARGRPRPGPARTSPAGCSTSRRPAACRPTSTRSPSPTCSSSATTPLWDEMTAADEVDIDERHLIEERIRRLNELGFDVGELVVEHDAAATGCGSSPALVEEGHHARELRRLTGLEVQENQARRLLNDIAAFGAYLARVEGRPPAPRRSSPPGGSPRSTSRSWPGSRRSCAAGGSRPSCSTSCSSTATSCPRPAGHEVDNETALESYIDSRAPVPSPGTGHRRRGVDGM